VSLAAKTGDITIDTNIGNSTDNLTLTAQTGSILYGNGLITANDLILIAGGTNASIGLPYTLLDPSETIDERYAVGTDTPVLIRVGGVLTADASNGSGGIFLEVPEVDITANKGTQEYEAQYAQNSITFASIDAGEGNIGITLAGSLNGTTEAITGYNQDTFLPIYQNGDYEAWRNGLATLDNVISGNDLIILADTVGLIAPPQMDVANMIMRLTGVGPHPQETVIGGYSSVLSVENTDPDMPNAGGRLVTYPLDPLKSFPERPGIIQLGGYAIDVDANITGLLSTSALVVVSPQQEALEEMLRKSGGEDFFMAPPLWIDIEMEDEEDKEEIEEELKDEFEDEFTYFKGPDLFGTPDLNNVKDMPSLLGQEAPDKGGTFLRISALEVGY
jgi:hypothetical protein